MRTSRRRASEKRNGRGPNAHLIGAADGRDRLATPALVLDLDVFDRNVAAMAASCRSSGISLRPHAKTHKSVRVARAQLQHGARGISVATLREASVMVDAGITGVLMTSPVVGEAKLELLARLAGRSRDLMVAVDSLEGAKALEAQFKRVRRSIRVLIDIDVGMKRTGVPDLKGALELARRVASSGFLEFAGVQCYSGMVQHIAGFGDRAATYRRELNHVEAVLNRLQRAGLTCGIVSGGGTGTFAVDRQAHLFTECQAGTYAFMDAQYNDVELFDGKARPFGTSLFVQSMVLSNNHRGAATVDAGFKSFAMDGPVPQPGRGAPRGTTFQFYGDEFGMLRYSPRRRQLRLGQKVEFVTPHCDPTVNLHNYFHCVRGKRLVDIWPVDARGTL